MPKLTKHPLRFDTSQECATRIVDCIFGLHAAMLLICDEALLETIEYLEQEILKVGFGDTEAETAYCKAGLEICKEEYQRRKSNGSHSIR